MARLLLLLAQQPPPLCLVDREVDTVNINYQPWTNYHLPFITSHAGNTPRASCFAEKSVLAQPVFVFEKKDRPCKRHAGDLTADAENSLCVCPEKRLRSSSFTFRPTQSSTDTDRIVLDKRVRSSSFTVLTSFPPNQPVIKNNVFLPSTLLQEQGRSTDAGNVHSWTVIKPATLQPPPVTTRRDVDTTEAADVSANSENKVHKEETHAPVSVGNQKESALGSTCTSTIKTR
uniref:Uncharacterized protein n=1 Tax=Engystomops pustulosus TaxID=76066 RepID=A0AAV6YRX9_ENGPU|nr:hypothetical protein GDO81_020535 [Engystomops pustulosus]